MNIKKGLSWIAILFIVFALAGCSASNKQYASEKPAIEQLVNDYFPTAYNIDYKTWTGEEELAYLTPEQADKMKKELAEFKDSFTTNQLTQTLDNLEIENVIVDSETTGSAFCTIQVSGSDNGSSFSQKIEYHLQVQKIDGRWLISELKVQKVE